MHRFSGEGHTRLQWDTTFLLKLSSISFCFLTSPAPRRCAVPHSGAAILKTRFVKKRKRNLPQLKQSCSTPKKCTLLVHFSIIINYYYQFTSSKPQIPPSRLSSATSEMFPPFEKRCYCDTFAFRKYFISVA